MYIADAAVAPVGDRLTLKESAGCMGWDYGFGATGLIALGDGTYYISYDGKTDDGWFTDVKLCRWNGTEPIEVVE